ncbi:hypothetical protein LTS18_007369 [Coniosporium uncinatum]|uniref:Uncharacterized protein n=1 Tax=Coniosporium uncinatum TaxID=93489 RepID=A0ACC3DCB0_9PEZI|nr:hypothetical protein LTS18_007369 [Coniosporium uncinatum]
MKPSVLATSAALFGRLALSLPTELQKRANIDTTVLQFALTLEHLENVFYKGALTKFSQRDFMKAGYSADYYNNLKYIAHDEEQHVELLTSALQAAGVMPVAACTYSFPYTDVRSFITLSSVLEGVGTSAYLGGAPLITDKGYLAVAGSILVTEAIHTSMQRGAVFEVPMANPYGTALDPTSVYTLAAAFITSCPTSNPPLPFTAFPSLALDATTCTCEEPDCSSPSRITRRSWFGHQWASKWSGSKSNTCKPAIAGSTVTFTAPTSIPAGSYLTFVNGLSVTSAQGSIKGSQISAPVPSADEGQTYVFVTSSDVEGSLKDAAVLFGPAILEGEMQRRSMWDRWSTNAQVVNPQPPSIDFAEA